MILVIIQCLSYDIMAQSKKYYDDDCLRSIEITIDSLLGEAIGKERYEQLYNKERYEQLYNLRQLDNRCIDVIVELELVDSNANVAVVSNVHLKDSKSLLSESEKERFVTKIFSTVFPDCSGYTAHAYVRFEGGYLDYIDGLRFIVHMPITYKPNFLYPKE